MAREKEFELLPAADQEEILPFIQVLFVALVFASSCYILIIREGVSSTNIFSKLLVDNRKSGLIEVEIQVNIKSIIKSITSISFISFKIATNPLTI